MAMSVVYTVVDGVIWQENRGGTITQYVPDTLGSVVAEMDEAGQVTHTADYWPYGEVRTETGTKKSPFGFVGMLGYMKDFADALYVRARYLRTKLARWQTGDPLWPREKLFNYAALQPTSVADGSGLAPIPQEGLDKTDGDKCRVWRCKIYGFGRPLLTHEFLCVTRPSGGCAGGFTSKYGWIVGPGEWSDTTRLCPPYNDDANTDCHLVSTNCRYADEVCRCIYASHLKDEPTYVLTMNNCVHYTHRMLRCGCRGLGLSFNRFKVGYCYPRFTRPWEGWKDIDLFIDPPVLLN